MAARLRRAGVSDTLPGKAVVSTRSRILSHSVRVVGSNRIAMLTIIEDVDQLMTQESPGGPTGQSHAEIWMGRLAVPLDNALGAGQALLQVFCGHYWHHLNAGVQSEEETFSHLRDLGRFLHIHHEKAGPFSTLRE